MQKLWKTLATIAVIVLLYLSVSPVSEHYLPKLPWVIVFVLALTYGISLIFSSEIALPRRLAISYLVFTGFVYLVAGVLGLVPNGDLIEASAWNSLISPYLLISFFDQWVHDFPSTIARAPYETLPMSKHHLFSAVVVILSTVAILAAFGMAKAYRVAYSAWLVLLGLLTVGLVGYVIVAFVSWGLKDAIIPLCWEASYIAAYVTARHGVELRPLSFAPGNVTSKFTN
ncbi:MAG: hypothetical protein JWO71_763 [Candidatus Acidoferrum typicum]|nr:hypothetical protein [Candidatus Acidoferrum typicum]